MKEIKTEINIEKLGKNLGIKFKNENLIIQSFCHRSYLNENPGFPLDHNERLEFLGDAVLELIITEYLYNKNPEVREGDLTMWRAALVNANMLGKVAEELDFNNYILLSRGEKRTEGKARYYILANAYEAFCGALYLDQGLKTTEKFVKKYLVKELEDVLKKGLHRDAKSYFQEKAQEAVGITPTYSILEEKGPDHAKEFTVGVFLDKELIARGNGSSKQEAEEQAAKEAIKIKDW